MKLKQLTLSVDSPICSIKQFADFLEVTEETVKGWIKRNYIPAVKVGKHNMINLVKYKQELSKQA